MSAEKEARGVRCYMLGGVVPGFESFEEALASMPAEPIAEELEGASMLYSSGTTGYPKGVKRPLVRMKFGEALTVPGNAGRAPALRLGNTGL